MLNGSIAMSGWTDSSGVVNFMMFPAISYQIVLENATIGLGHSTILSPKDSSYVIYSALANQFSGNSTLDQLGNTTSPLLWITEPDIYHVTFCGGFRDTSSLTTDLIFEVWQYGNTTSSVGLPAQKYVYDFGNPGTNYITDCNFTAINQKGDEYKWFWNISRSAPL